MWAPLQTLTLHIQEVTPLNFPTRTVFVDNRRNSGLPTVIVSLRFVAIANSRDGAAQGGLCCLWRRWFRCMPILRSISALWGETSPFTEHLFTRTGVKLQLGADGLQERKGHRVNLVPDSPSFFPPPPRNQFLDYGDVAEPRRVIYRRFPRLARNMEHARNNVHESDFVPVLLHISVISPVNTPGYLF